MAEIDTRGTAWAAGGGSVKLQRTTEHPRHTGTLYELLRSSIRAGMWEGKALIVTVDELQTVEPEAMRNLHMLHQGEHGCPILIVGIGLQHTQDVLAHPRDGSAGISRTAHPVTLGCLSHDEAVDAVAGNMDAFGHDISEGCAEALAKASFGFPNTFTPTWRRLWASSGHRGHWTKKRGWTQRLKEGTSGGYGTVKIGSAA